MTNLKPTVKDLYESVPTLYHFDNFKDDINVTNLGCCSDSDSKQKYYLQSYVKDKEVIKCHDGAIACKKECLELKSCFKTFRSDLLDKERLTLVVKEDWPVPKDGILSASTVMSCKVKGGVYEYEDTKLDLCDPNDFRGAHTFFQLQDPFSLLTCGFVMTNGQIYVRYSLSSVARMAGTHNKNCWEHLVPVAYRNHYNPQCDFVKLEVQYNYRQGVVNWLVNDCIVHTQCRLGFPLNRKYRVVEYTGCQYSLIEPKKMQLQVGVGLMPDAFYYDEFGRVSYPLMRYLKADQYISPEKDVYDKVPEAKEGYLNGSEAHVCYKYLAISYIPPTLSLGGCVEKDCDYVKVFKDFDKLDGVKSSVPLLAKKK